MNIDINDKIISDFKKHVPWLAFETSEKEFIEDLLKKELYALGVDDYHIDKITNTFTFYRLNYDVQAIQREILNGERNNFIKTILCYDVKNLKKINDYYGLQKGDEILSNLGNWLNNEYKDDKVYRVGGDEFSVLSFKDIDIKKYEYDNVVLKSTKITIKLNRINYGHISFVHVVEDILKKGIKISNENYRKIKWEIKSA
jgi:diguanylate cyclase (GGDEF)-like protein